MGWSGKERCKETTEMTAELPGKMVAPLEWRGMDGFEKYLKGRVVREISVISDMQMTPPL